MSAKFPRGGGAGPFLARSLTKQRAQPELKEFIYYAITRRFQQTRKIEDSDWSVHLSTQCTSQPQGTLANVLIYLMFSLFTDYLEAAEDPTTINFKNAMHCTFL